MHYLVIEHFRGGNPEPVYARFKENGRMAPAGLAYVGSWVTEDMAVCYQVMQCEDRQLLDEWMANWRDIVDFEVVPVMTSAEAASRALANGDSPK
jgi:hypothetical protein